MSIQSFTHENNDSVKSISSNQSPLLLQLDSKYPLENSMKHSSEHECFLREAMIGSFESLVDFASLMKIF